MKTVGIVLIFLSVFSVGVCFSKREISVLKSIKRAEDFLTKIILNLKNEHLTVSEILEKIRFDSDSETKRFLDSIRPEDLESAAKSAFLCGFIKNKTAASIFYEAVSVLGKYEINQQLEELEFCRQKLRLFYEKNENDIKTKAKLFAYCGFFGGILVAIMLV